MPKPLVPPYLPQYVQIHRNIHFHASVTTEASPLTQSTTENRTKSREGEVVRVPRAHGRPKCSRKKEGPVTMDGDKSSNDGTRAGIEAKGFNAG